jgi:hypothetical protein
MSSNREDEDEGHALSHGSQSLPSSKGKGRAEIAQSPPPRPARPASPWIPHLDLDDQRIIYNENDDDFDSAEIAAAMAASLASLDTPNDNGAGPSRVAAMVTPSQMLSAQTLRPQTTPRSSSKHASYHHHSLPGQPKARLKPPRPRFYPTMAPAHPPPPVPSQSEDWPLQTQLSAVPENPGLTHQHLRLRRLAPEPAGGADDMDTSSLGTTTATHSACPASISATAPASTNAALGTLPEVIQLPLQMALVFRELDELKAQGRNAVQALQHSRHVVDVQRVDTTLRRSASLAAQISLTHHHRRVLRALLSERRRQSELAAATGACGAKCKCGRRCKGVVGPAGLVVVEEEEVAAHRAGGELFDSTENLLKELVDLLARSSAELSDDSGRLTMDDMQDRSGYYHAIAHAHYKNWALATVLLQNVGRHGNRFEESRMANKFLEGGVQHGMLSQFPEIERFDWAPR